MVVRGGLFDPVLLDTTKAGIIIFYGADEKPHTLIFRELTDDMWAMVNREDPDWEASMIRLGIIQPPGGIR